MVYRGMNMKICYNILIVKRLCFPVFAGRVAVKTPCPLLFFLSFPPAFSEKVGGQRDSLFRFCEAKMYLWNKTVTRHSLKRKKY